MSELPEPGDRTQSFGVLSQGAMIGHYRIDSRIGVGGMGEVYLAEDTKLNRQVALKFLPPQMAADPELRARFRREARAAAKLDHPHIVTVYEVGESENRLFIAMQYVAGRTLRQHCQAEPLPLAKAVCLVGQVADGLAGAHEQGITHRDIKPANIIVDRDLRPKILDFGLATIQGGDLLTRDGSTVGTLAYMSPEQARGQDADQRSDIFSLGAVLYELVAGCAPFRRDNDAATLNALLNESPRPLSQYKSDLPQDLERIVSKCLAKDPSSRYQLARDLHSDLDALAANLKSGNSSGNIGIAEVQPTIAVLPFANMSADPENEYFSDGLTEELLNLLAKNAELKVTGRTSSFAFKGKQEDLRDIGRKLGVATLLEGSVRKSGNRVRITTQLVNAADGFHLWSETYDRVLEDVFAVQDEIAGAVARELHVTLLGKSTEKKLKDPESFSLVLRGNHLMQQFSHKSCESAIKLYERAIDLYPENAPAWAGLARSYLIAAAYGYGDTQEAYKCAQEAAQRVLALDDQLPEAHEVNGWLQATFELDFEKSLASFRRGLELAPNSSRMVSTMAMLTALTGNVTEALSLAERGIEIDPLNPEAYMNLAKILLWAGKYEDSREACSSALELSPEISSIHLTISWTYLLEGRLEEAREALEREQAPGYRFCGEAMVFYSLGMSEESDRALEELLKQGVQWGFQIAAVYGYRGELDKAFEWLHKAADQHDAGMPFTKVSPFLTSLHSDPRWPELLKRIGFTE